MNADEYVIYSPKHTKGEAIWWGPNESGYTRDLNRAGVYTEERAKEIERLSHRDAIAIKKCDAVAKLAGQLVVDLGFSINGAQIEELTQP